MKEFIQLSLAILSGAAAIITIFSTEYGVLKGRYNADWAALFRSFLSFMAVAAFFFVTTLFSDRQALLRWSSHAYLLVAAFIFLGAGIVIWAGVFNRFQHLSFYIFIGFNLVYSGILMFASDKRVLVSEEVVGYYGAAVFLQMLLTCERFAYSKIGYPSQESVEEFRHRVQKRSLGRDSISRPKVQPGGYLRIFSSRKNPQNSETHRNRSNSAEPHLDMDTNTTDETRSGSGTPSEQKAEVALTNPDYHDVDAGVDTTKSNKHEDQGTNAQGDRFSASDKNREPSVNVNSWSRLYTEEEAWARLLGYSYFGATTCTMLILLGN